jgi:hypothetical protein
MHIRGMTGALKSVWMCYLAVQIIYLTGSPALIIDYGGDQFVANAIKQLVASQRRVFRFLSTQENHASCSFEPLQSCVPLTMHSAVKVANFLVSSLSLDYGEGWGKSYFSKHNYSLLLRVVLDFIRAGKLSPRFRELAARIARLARPKRMSDIPEAQLSAEQLLPYEQLSSGDSPEDDIRVRQAIENGQIVYGFLPALLEPPARAIGALLLWSYVMEARLLMQAGRRFNTIYVFVDEFAAVAAAKAFADLLAEARRITADNPTV